MDSNKSLNGFDVIEQKLTYCVFYPIIVALSLFATWYFIDTVILVVNIFTGGR